MFCIWYHVMGVDLLGLQKDRIGVLLEQVQGEWRQRSGSPPNRHKQARDGPGDLAPTGRFKFSICFQDPRAAAQHGHFQKVHGPSAAWYASMGN